MYLASKDQPNMPIRIWYNEEALSLDRGQGITNIYLGNAKCYRKLANTALLLAILQMLIEYRVAGNW